MPAVAACPADIVIVADADCWTDGLPPAIEAVERGAPWAIPHSPVHRLNQTGTANVLDGNPPDPRQLEQPPYPGVAGGGFLVAPRDTLLDVPLDPRFVGWGQEDECWAMALEARHGPPWRGTADLLHLWHPPQERLDRRRGTREGWLLRRRYLKARHDPVLMRELLSEAHDALSAPQHPRDDHQPLHVG